MVGNHSIAAGGLLAIIAKETVAFVGGADVGSGLGGDLGPPLMTHLRHGVLQTFAVQKDYSFLR